MSTPQTPRTISPPTAKTAESVVSVPVPSAKTAETPIAISTPTAITNEAVGTIATPTAKTSQAVGTISTPTASTAQSVGNIATPTAATAEAGVSVPVPSVYQSLVGAPINRALTPYFNFNASLANFDGITYTRASNATRIESYANARGIKAKRMKTDFNGSVTNSLVRSEQFENAAWGKSTNVTVNKTGQKFNGSDVYLFKNDVAGTFERLFQNVTNTGVHTFSIIVKANTQSVCFIRLEGTDLGEPTAVRMTYRVDLKNERISYESSVSAVDRAVVNLEYLSDGFYRVSVTPDSASTITVCAVYLSWLTATAGSLFITQAQLSNTNVPAPYVKTLSTTVSQTFTAQPRIEDDGILVEGSRTNVILNSEDLQSASYLNANIIYEGFDYDFGVKMAKISANSTNASHIVRQLTTALAGEQIVTSSFFAKKGSTQRYIRMQLREDTNNHRAELAIDLHTGVIYNEVDFGSAIIINSGVIDYGDYIRICVSVDFNVSPTNHQLIISLLGSSTPTDTNFVGDSFSTMIVGGLQIEAGEVPTSYIKTLGATVSRASETIRADMSLNQEFSIVAEGSYPFNNGTTQRRLLNMYDATGNNELIFYNSGASNYDNSAVLGIDGVFTAPLNATVVNNGETSTAVLTRDNGTYNYYYQGALAEQLEAGLPFEISRINIGEGLSGLHLNGYIKRIEVYNHAFTASEVKSR